MLNVRFWPEADTPCALISWAGSPGQHSLELAHGIGGHDPCRFVDLRAIPDRARSRARCYGLALVSRALGLRGSWASLRWGLGFCGLARVLMRMPWNRKATQPNS